MIKKIRQESAEQTSLSDRLSQALNELGMTRAELARRINTSPQIIHYLCKGNAKKSHLTYDIADALGVQGEWLANGTGHMRLDKDPKLKLMSNQCFIPIVRYVDLKNNYHKTGDFCAAHKTEEYLLTTSDVGDKGFAVKLQDMSMHPRFDRDTIVILNTDKNPNHKEFVLAYIDAIDDIVFRQIELHQDEKLLKPTNTALYKVIALEKNDKIIGTLVEARWHTS